MDAAVFSPVYRSVTKRDCVLSGISAKLRTVAALQWLNVLDDHAWSVFFLIQK